MSPTIAIAAPTMPIGGKTNTRSPAPRCGPVPLVRDGAREGDPLHGGQNPANPGTAVVHQARAQAIRGNTC